MGVNNIKLPQDYIIFRDDPEYSMSTRQKEQYEKWSKFLQLGRQNPCWFVEEVFGIELLDYQRYIMMNSWTTPYNVWCCSRSSGKTTMGAIYIMAKTILVPGFKTYILCNSGQQSVEMFTKLEQIATKAIPSFKSLTDVFVNELVKSQANTNGFVHNPASYTCRTYNNSQVFTLNGCFD